MRELIEKEIFDNIFIHELFEVETDYCEVPCEEQLDNMCSLTGIDRILALKKLEPGIKKAISLNNDVQLLAWLTCQHCEYYR